MNTVHGAKPNEVNVAKPVVKRTKSFLKLWLILGVVTGFMWLFGDSLAIMLGGEMCVVEKCYGPAMIVTVPFERASDYSFALMFLQQEADPGSYLIMYAYYQAMFVVAVIWFLVGLPATKEVYVKVSRVKSSKSSLVPLVVLIAGALFLLWAPLQGMKKGVYYSGAYSSGGFPMTKQIFDAQYLLVNLESVILYPDHYQNVKDEHRVVFGGGKYAAEKAKGATVAEKIEFLKEVKKKGKRAWIDYLAN